MFYWNDFWIIFCTCLGIVTITVSTCLIVAMAKSNSYSKDMDILGVVIITAMILAMPVALPIALHIDAKKDKQRYVHRVETIYEQYTTETECPVCQFDGPFYASELPTYGKSVFVTVTCPRCTAWFECIDASIAEKETN